MSSSSSSFMPKSDVFLDHSRKDTSDVFLSCSGKDSSKTLVTDLIGSLSHIGITTYVRDADSEHRDPYYFKPKESKLAVVVFSKNYPTSCTFLNELQTIVRFQEEGKFSVLPIFYGVDPCNVRNQTGHLADTFERLGKHSSAHQIQDWRSALTKFTNMLGLDSRAWSKEEKVIDLITEEILSIILDKPIRPSSTKPEGLVGMDRHMQVLYELLDLKATKEVRLIGIWGLGGIGKTTLARYAYEQLSTSFHAHIFVDNSKMIHHQEGVETGMESSNMSTDVIKSTVGHRKSLLVIDSVDNMEQLKDIADLFRWCGSGSRVILITQDKNLLDECGVEHVYEVQSLRYDEALRLFSQYAFMQPNPPTSFESLSLRAVQIAGFLPLSLKILGSSLQRKDEEDWDEELQKLEGEEEKAILEVMKRSYTRADEEEEEPFF